MREAAVASFVRTSYDVTGETLLDGETGYVGRAAELVVGDAPAVTGAGAASLTVNGTIASIGAGFAAFDFDGADALLFVGPEGYLVATGADAVIARATGSIHVATAGTFQTAGASLDLRAADAGAAITVNSSGSLFGGLILAPGAGRARVVNTGTILAHESAAFAIPTGGAANSGPIKIVNRGVVTGDEAVYDGTGAAGSETIRNTGELFGQIDLGPGPSLYNGRRGLVDGTVDGGGGNDTLIGGGEAEHFQGGAGTDLLVGGADDDTLDGGDDPDMLRGGGDDDSLMGDNGHDTLLGGRGDDTLDGGDKADLLRGGGGDDSLLGDVGWDILVGGGGEDTLLGGGGHDTFVFAPGGGVDIVEDFAPGTDTLDLSRHGFADFAALSSSIVDRGGGTRIALGDGDALLLLGVVAAALGANDFIF